MAETVDSRSKLLCHLNCRRAVDVISLNQATSWRHPRLGAAGLSRGHPHEAVTNCWRHSSTGCAALQRFARHCHRAPLFSPSPRPQRSSTLQRSPQCEVESSQVESSRGANLAPTTGDGVAAVTIPSLRGLVNHGTYFGHFSGADHRWTRHCHREAGWAAPFSAPRALPDCQALLASAGPSRCGSAAAARPLLPRRLCEAGKVFAGARSAWSSQSSLRGSGDCWGLASPWTLRSRWRPR